MTATLHQTVQEALEASGLSAQATAVSDDPDGTWIDGLKIVALSNPTMSVVLDRVAQLRGTPDRATAAGLFWKAYSYHAAVRIVAPWVRDRVAIDGSLDRIAWDIETTTIPRTAFTSIASCQIQQDSSGQYVSNGSRAPDSDLAAVLDVFLYKHLAPLSRRVRSEVSIGARALTGLSIASILSVAAANVRGSLAQRNRLIDRVVAALPPSEQQFAIVTEIRPPDESWQPFALRASCCLAYKLSDGKYCGTCNLLSAQERTQQLRNSGFEWRPRPPTTADT